VRCESQSRSQDNVRGGGLPERASDSWEAPPLDEESIEEEFIRAPRSIEIQKYHRIFFKQYKDNQGKTTSR